MPSMRYILLYIFGLISFTASRLEILDQIDQPQQVYESGKSSPPGMDHERVDLTDIGPTCREKGRFPFFGIIKNSPLAPTTPAINKLKLPSAPGMKWVGYPKILFCILHIGCSSRSTPSLISIVPPGRDQILNTSTGDKSPAYFLLVPPGHTGTATASNAEMSKLQRLKAYATIRRPTQAWIAWRGFPHDQIPRLDSYI